MEYVAYGMDFGTANSSISVVDTQGKTTVLPVGREGAKVVKSIIFFPGNSDQVLIGQEAIESYALHGNAGRLIQSVKSALADESFVGTTINGKRYQIEDLIALIIAYLRTRADSILGKSVDRVVMGRPAIFSDDPSKEDLARARLTAAAEKAGFTQISFQMEPIAAAFHYEETMSRPQTVLVADLGGGTSDFSLLRLSPERLQLRDRQADILRTNGVYVGGDNFDAQIMKAKVARHFGSEATYRSGDNWLRLPHRIINSICDWRKLSFIRDNRYDQELLRRVYASANNVEAISYLRSLIDNNLGFSLARAVEAAKCLLSDAEQSTIDFCQKDIRLKENISRNEFELAIRDELEKIENCLDKLLLAADVTATDINTVFLTGGTSFVPAVRRLFQEQFGSAKVIAGDAFTSVASGLALSAKLFF